MTTTRPPWKKTLMNIAHEVARRSTCARMKTGAILVKENRIISMGYNGSPSGDEHCNTVFKEYFEGDEKLKNNFKTYENFLSSDSFKSVHHEYSIQHEIHAEMNAILFAAKNGVSTADSELYVTYSPCIHCAKSILQAGIKCVYYDEEYDRSSISGIKFLIENNVRIEKI